MRGQALSAPRVAAVSALAVVLVAAGVFLYRAKRRKYVYEPPHRMNSTEAPDPKDTDIPQEFLCPITKELMNDPVFTADGHTYEREAIRRWLQEHQSSPYTGQPLPDKVLRPNHALRGQIIAFCQKRNLPLPPEREIDSQEHVAPAQQPDMAAHVLAPQAVLNGIMAVLRHHPLLLSQLGMQLGRVGAQPHEVAQTVMARPDLTNWLRALLASQPLLMQQFEHGAAGREIAPPAPTPPIVDAVLAGDCTAVEALLARTPGSLPMTPDGRTLLHLAARAGHERMVDLLVARGLQVDAKDTARVTPLMIASEHGRTACATRLLDHGASIASRAAGGVTALHLAALGGHTEVVRLLLARGLEPQCTREDGATPLFGAAFCGHLACCELLADAATVARSDIHGATALHAAAGNGQEAVARLLIARGADVNAKIRGGDTPLIRAVGHPVIVSVLLAARADIHHVRSDGHTALHFAAWRNADETVQLLVGAGAHMDAVNRDIFTPLHCAVWSQSTRAALRLIELGAPLEAGSNNQSTPLHFACWHGNHLIARALLERGANRFTVTMDGDTPLHQAAFGNHVQCIELLLEGLPDSDRLRLVNARKFDGTTALLLAAARGLFPAVRALIAGGADARIANQGGVTAAELAQQFQHLDIAEFLRSHM